MGLRQDPAGLMVTQARDTAQEGDDLVTGPPFSPAGGPPSAGGPPPVAVLMPMLFGGLIQQCIRAVAILKVADLLAGGPQTVGELAQKAKAHESSLYRVLRTLASAGIFAETSGRSFELTPIGELLRSDVPESLHDFAILQGEDWNWRGSGQLVHTLRTGEPAHDKVHGMNLFEFLQKHPTDGALFNRAMTSYSLAAIPAIVGGYEFSDIRKLVDVGGGYGSFLVAILKANPGAHGVVFDLPAVVKGAEYALAGAQNRPELVAGDFFESVPSGADAYILKNVIHDWDDDRASKILKNIAIAMAPAAKVLIVDMVVPAGNEPGPAKLVDMQMIVTTGGKERSEEEFRELLSSAGLKLTRVLPTMSPMSIIEAVGA